MLYVLGFVILAAAAILLIGLASRGHAPENGAPRHAHDREPAAPPRHHHRNHQLPKPPPLVNACAERPQLVRARDADSHTVRLTSSEGSFALWSRDRN
jgi:hypothetical protein